MEFYQNFNQTPSMKGSIQIFWFLIFIIQLSNCLTINGQNIGWKHSFFSSLFGKIQYQPKNSNTSNVNNLQKSKQIRQIIIANLRQNHILKETNKIVTQKCQQMGILINTQTLLFYTVMIKMRVQFVKINVQAKKDVRNLFNSILNVKEQLHINKLFSESQKIFTPLIFIFYFIYLVPVIFLNKFIFLKYLRLKSIRQQKYIFLMSLNYLFFQKIKWIKQIFNLIAEIEEKIKYKKISLQQFSKITLSHYLFIDSVMFLLQNCTKSASIFASSLQTQALLPGTSDIVIVKHKTGHYKSTPFLACFGPFAVLSQSKEVSLFINGVLVSDLKFNLDQHGYSYPMYPSDVDIRKMGLKFGKNQIRYQLDHHQLKAEVHLFTDNDKILVSDVDGTLTKNDIGGLASNAFQKNYLHDGYAQLIKAIQDNGYKIVWLTMRSLPLYQFSKKYIQTTVGVSGALITQPEEFLPAIKKQILKKTGNIKANLMNQIKKLYPPKINPFIGGLGNRQNDAIAYYHAGVPLDSIFIIDTKSYVHKLDTPQFGLTYKQMISQIQNFFPKYHALRIGY